MESLTNLITPIIAAMQEHLVSGLQMEASRYAFGTLTIFFLVWVLFSNALSGAGRKIRQQGRPKGQIKRELLYSAQTMLIFVVLDIMVFASAGSGVFKSYLEISDYGWAWFGLSIPIMIVAHDAWFYWTHRMIHHPKLFKIFHKTHHRSHNPTPFTAYSFDPGEAAINYAFVPIFLMLVPVHPIATKLFLLHMILRNAMGHCGYELMPKSWVNHPLLGQFSSVIHHDMHHERITGNYGLYFTWWDKWMGTEHADYRKRLAVITHTEEKLTVPIPALAE